VASEGAYPLLFITNANERARIDSSGRLLVGTSTARVFDSASATLTPLNQIESTGSEAAFSVTRNNNTNTGPSIFLGKSRGAAIGGVTVVASGDQLGSLVFEGTDGAKLVEGAAIRAEVDGTPGTDDMPGRLVFSTTADGASSPTERMRIDSAGNIGIGTTTPNAPLNVNTSTNANATSSFGGLFLSAAGATAGLNNLGAAISFSRINTTRRGAMIASVESGADTDQQGLAFFTRGLTTTASDEVAERMRIDDQGRLLVGSTTASATFTGTLHGQSSVHGLSALTTASSGNTAISCERSASDGDLIRFVQATVTEGTISVSGTTVTYGGGHLARWSQLPNNEDPSGLLKGTVMSNLEEMCEWGEEDNEQLNKTKISDVEGDPNVAGVFVSTSFSDDGPLDFFVAMTGDMIIRIAEGVTVQRGDLLMSAGDGTAKPQDDDIIRSKTVAKVTSAHVTCTYDDGSYCVPCVLMAC
jgi:hypothetical protein